MKTLPIYIALSMALLTSKAQTQNVGDIDAKALESQVDALVGKYLDLDIFSGVVLISKSGEPLYEKSFGLANRNENKPNTPDTHFDIGSMNKTFTKVVVLQLIAEGKLKPDDKVGRYLDGFPPEVANHVTIEQLLEHRSGLGTYHTPEYFSLPLQKKSMATNLAFIRQEKLAFPPGTDQRYSNSGYVLLGAIVEKATGKPYFDVVENRIVAPLGMTETYVRDKYTVPNRAIGYYKGLKGELLDNDHFQERPTPAGGFMSTVGDISKFYRAYYYSDRLLNDVAKASDPAWKFYMESRKNGSAVVQAGGFEGANTANFELLRDSISIMVFANMDEPVAEELGAGILAILRGERPDSPTLPAMQNVYGSYVSHGLDFVEAHWDSLTTNYHPADPKHLILNQIGYEIMDIKNRKSIKKALKIFQLNTKLYPEVGNVWDSYGEALLAEGDSAAALAAYKKALSLNPGLPTAEQAVEKLLRTAPE